MTTLVAARSGNVTVVGSDTLALLYGDMKHDVGPKWVFWGDWGLGLAGDRRTKNIVEANAKQLFDDCAGAYEFTVRLMSLLHESGFERQSGREVPDHGQQMLLAHKSGPVWFVDSSYTIIEGHEGEVMATGSGHPYAVGAAHALQDKPIMVRVKAALEAAMAYDYGSGGEAWVRVMGDS